MTEKYIVCFGEILWDNLKTGRRLGGAPLNVCYHLNKLGIKSTIISQVGLDKDGRAILKELKRLEIDSTFCSTISNKPTSTVEVDVGDAGEVVYDIVDDVAWDYIESSPAIEGAVAKASVLVFGSLIARNPVSQETLFKLVEKSRFRVFDVNLRHPFYSKNLILSLLEVTNILKLNAIELDIISGWLGNSDGCFDSRVNYIQRHFPGIEEIILTLGGDGAKYYSASEQLTINAQPVKIKDTVGSGDAFLAGFLAYKMEGRSVKDSLQIASHISSYVAGQQGACPDYRLEDML